MNYTKEIEKEELIVKWLYNKYNDDITRLIFELANHTITKMEQQEEHKKNYEIRELLQNRSETNEAMLNLFGYFYFNFYNKLLKINLDRQYLFRFIYLCTFMNYENVLCFGNAKDNKMTERDLQEVLNLSKSETIKTKNALIENNMLIINKDKSISINKDFCKKGKVNKRKLKGSVRMFEEAIQELYSKSKTIEHKKLALLIEILPYLHFNYNVVCKNPTANEKDDIEAITITELSKMLGYSTPQKLRKSLFEITINGEKVIMESKIDKVNMIVVNPRIYYKGNKWENMLGVVKLFDIANFMMKK